MRNKEKSNLIIGAIIGGILGGGALFLLKSSRNIPQAPSLSKMGRTIAEIGEILEKGPCETGADALDEIQNNIPNGEMVNNVLSWVATGITLWNKFKKGS